MTASLLRRSDNPAPLGDLGREYARAVIIRRRQVWLRLAITLVVGGALTLDTHDPWVPGWILAVLLTQFIEIAGFVPLVRGGEATPRRILRAVLGSIATTTAFGFAAPLMWARGGTEAGAGSVMFLFGGSMMALMASQGSLPAFLGTVLPYLLLGIGTSLSPMLLGHETAVTWPLFIGFVVLTSVMCLLWQSSARARRSETEARLEIERGRERAEAAEQEVRKLAFSDVLTGLPNRRSFDALLADENLGDYALLLLDLNGFKRINDKHGHATGDELLSQVGSRLLRYVEAPNAVARLGGDEFGIIVHGKNATEAVEFAWRVVDSIEQPFITRFGALRVGTSVGIAFSDQHAQDSSELMRKADLALYRSKATGFSGLRVFEPEMEHRGSPDRLPANVEGTSQVGRRAVR